LQNYAFYQPHQSKTIIKQETSISPIQQIYLPIFEEKLVEVFVKRDDLLHPSIMGNKWRKLKYNLEEAKNQGHTTILTFGGAFSNHIYAVASAGKEFGFETIGIIRGDELDTDSNPTLKYATEMGMELIFVSRTEYLSKDFLFEKYGQNSYILPEGGTNLLALKGCKEIVHEIESQMKPSHICVAVGTGGTFAGMISARKEGIKIIGFPVLKGFGIEAIQVSGFDFSNYNNFEICSDYHFGGYGKYNKVFIDFMQTFENEHNIPLEQVYNGKVFYGVFEMIQKNYFPKESKIVVVHTGGLQGKLEMIIR
jgi:1-aminocyclopropane-1-carboxylate deaminase